MGLAIVLLALLTALGKTASYPDHMVVVPDPTGVDASDDSITVFAQPIPYGSRPINEAYQYQNYPNYFRFGLWQQNPGTWYPPTNTPGGGIFYNKLGNKFFLSNIFQNIPPFNPSFPNFGGSNSKFGSYGNKIQQFLNSAQQGVQQLIAAAQNFKDDKYYQYGPTKQGIFSSLWQNKYPNYQFRQSVPQAEEEVEPQQTPVYQVIAVMPLYNSPPIQVDDLLRQRAMDLNKMSPGVQTYVVGGQVRGEGMAGAIKSAIQRELTREMSQDSKAGTVVMEQVDIDNFAKDVAEEVASVVRSAAQKPGKVSEIVVKVDAEEEDSDEDDDGDDMVNDGKKTAMKKPDAKDKVVKKEDGTKKPSNKENKPNTGKVPDDDDSDEDSSNSSDSSDSSDSSETPPPPTPPPTPPQKAAREGKELKSPPKKIIAEDESGPSSEESSEEVGSVEKTAKKGTAGARPIKTELEYVLMKGQGPSDSKTQPVSPK